jgi:hypothetical protein
LTDALFDAGHAPLFGGVAMGVLVLLRARRPGTDEWKLRAQAFVVTVAVGVVTEALQFFQADRDPALNDLARDAAGAAAFLLLWRWRPAAGPAVEAERAVRRRRAAIAAGVVLLAASAGTLALTSAAYAGRDRAMPTLVAFDGSWWERWFVHAGDASTLTSNVAPPQGERGAPGIAARLDLRPATYPGLTVDEPYPDWRAYRRLVLTVVSDSEEPLALTIRVHDAAHDQRFMDRFNRTFTVERGVNRVAFSLDDIRRAPDRRELDLARIRGIVLFAHRPARSMRVYLGPIRLE